MSPDTTAQDITNTSRDTTIAQWGVAALVMAGSATAGGFTFHYLGEHPALGVLTALAVDLALAVWLLISRRLRNVGVTAFTGRVLEVVTLTMTLYLNIGAAAFRGIDQSGTAARWWLGVAHSFLPVVLFLVSLAGAEAQHQLTTVRRNTEHAERARRAEQQAEHDAAEHAQAHGVLTSAQALHTEAVELRRQAEHEAQQAEHARNTTRVALQEEQAAAEQLRNIQAHAEREADELRNKRATPEERRAWVRNENAVGRFPTGGDVNRRFGAPRNGARIVTDVTAERTRLTVVS